MSEGSLLDHGGIRIRLYCREWKPGYVANVDLLDIQTGVTFRRWWPVPHESGGLSYQTREEAEAAALRFARHFIDALPPRGY